MTRFRALDGWRGICALLVAAHHLEVRGLIYWQPLVRNAWLFVDFFFVLSGFVIAHAYGERLSQAGETRAFVVRRFARLWPLHTTVLAAFVVIELVHLAIAHWYPLPAERIAFSPDRSPFAILTNVFLVQALGLHAFETWNGPSWSISVEFWTYLLFAGVCAATHRRAARLVVSLLLAIAAAAVLARFSDYGMRETFRWALPRCVFGFFLGTLAHELWRLGAARFTGGTLFELAALGLVILFLTYVPGHARLEYLAPLLFAFVVLVFAGDGGLISRVLRLKAPAALGRWSYSIYMVHTLVLVMAFSSVRVVESLFGRHWLALSANGQAGLPTTGPELGALLYLIYLAATVALSALSWRFIELPGQRFFGNFVRPKKVMLEALRS